MIEGIIIAIYLALVGPKIADGSQYKEYKPVQPIDIVEQRKWMPVGLGFPPNIPIIPPPVSN